MTSARIGFNEHVRQFIHVNEKAILFALFGEVAKLKSTFNFHWLSLFQFVSITRVLASLFFLIIELKKPISDSNFYESSVYLHSKLPHGVIHCIV